jgi:hypothetical protein
LMTNQFRVKNRLLNPSIFAISLHFTFGFVVLIFVAGILLRHFFFN